MTAVVISKMYVIVNENFTRLSSFLYSVSFGLSVLIIVLAELIL
jgi:hypothetical protein